MNFYKKNGWIHIPNVILAKVISELRSRYKMEEVVR